MTLMPVALSLCTICLPLWTLVPLCAVDEMSVVRSQLEAFANAKGKR